MKRLTASSLVLVASLAGCSTYEGAVGSARATITQVPAGVACVQIIAAAGRTLTYSADVMPGSSSQMTLDNVPVGNVTFTGFAYPTSCATTAGTKPTWASTPTLGTILPGQVTNISLTLDQVGGANVGVNFDTDGGTVADGGMVADGGSGSDGGMVAAACGNGVREPGEQCDDGNVVNLDGCDSRCQFEQDQRANSLQMLFNTDMVCTANAIGTAVASVAQSNLQASYTSGVNNGSLTFGFKFSLLSNLNGISSPMVELGNLSGVPAMASAGVTYNGNSDLDWWYTSDPSLIDGARNPLQLLGGSISASVLTAGPGSWRLPLGIGNNGPVNVSNLRLRGNIGLASVPIVSSGASPGHLAGEHLDPMLSSFGSISNGELCGNVSASSLATLPLPAALGSGSGKCINNAGSTVLELLVNGCTASVAGVNIQLVHATPTADQVDPGAPVVGAGGPYTFVTDMTGHVSSCKDKSGGVVALPGCLNAAAYSTAFTFTTDRVVFK
jgi:cysteine-rich repeat protein